mmetsp:Transcript_71349/g.172664  ORF Transcript_71349/g.172664 Transcript_71349/m.172664 type:complete len:540 (-) Transcript_71349:147-1766(-)
MSNMAVSDLVKSKLDEFFWEWLSLPESQRIVRQAVRGDSSRSDSLAPNFHALRGSPSGRPSPPGSPHSRGILRDGLNLSDGSISEWPSSNTLATTVSGASQDTAHSVRSPSARESDQTRPPPKIINLDTGLSVGTSMLTKGSKVIPRFYWPKKQRPSDSLNLESRHKIHEIFSRQNITDGIRTHTQLEPIVTEVFKLSKYFVVPIFHKIKVFYDIVDAAAKSKSALLNPSPVPLTEQMVVGWAQGKIQPDDLVLSFFYVVKKDHNDWIEREDFSIFLTAILLTHPGLDFLRETQEFQDRYADTVISRIFFVYDRKDVGRIHLNCLRRYKPSVTETWKQLADHDDIKMVRDYFSYEHFYVIYCTFWELDSDHDFLLDKDDLLKYDGHALSRRAVDRIFSELPTKFTSTVPGKMGYEDFIRFLLCDQDRQTDRSMEYWFYMFDLDGDGCIRDHEMKYFYEGVFRLSDFKRKRKHAGTFFSLFSSLNKFLAFEHRDPFLAKQDQMDNPNFSDWDRWCADEYLRLAMEEGEEPDEGDGDRGVG